MARKKISSRTSLRPVPVRKKERRELEFLGSAALLLFGLLIGGAFLLTSLHKTLLTSPHVAAVVASTLVDLTNGDRAANNLTSLTVNPQLVAIAQAKANDMAAKSYFSHVSPEGHDPWHWFKEGGYAFEYAGENLAVDFSDSMDVERAWMQSPSHRKNILDPNFTEIGIATAVGTYQGRTTIFVAQAFGAPSVKKVQQPIQAAVVPDNPKQTAIAKAEPAPEIGEKDKAVLGSVAAAEQKPIELAVAAELADDATHEKPLWRFFVSFPRETLRTTYFALGLLILLGLAVDTGLEVRRHHVRRALRAGVLVVVMLVLLTVAEVFYFAEPVVALAS